MTLQIVPFNLVKNTHITCMSLIFSTRKKKRTAAVRPASWPARWRRRKVLRRKGGDKDHGWRRGMTQWQAWRATEAACRWHGTKNACQICRILLLLYHKETWRTGGRKNAACVSYILLTAAVHTGIYTPSILLLWNV